MNVSYVKTNNLQQKTIDNEPIKQSQTKPNERREVAGLTVEIFQGGFQIGVIVRNAKFFADGF